MSSVHIVMVFTAYAMADSSSWLSEVYLLLLKLLWDTLVLLNELLFQNLVDLLRSHANGLIAGLHQTFNLGGKNDEFGLIQLDRVLTLDESPVDAFEDTLLDRFLVAFKSFDQELHVGFDEEDFPFLLLTKGVELKHLNKALTGFLNYRDLELV